MLPRRSLCALFALLAIGLAACGGTDRPTQVAAEGAPDPGAASSSTTTTGGVTTTAVPPSAEATTTVAPSPAADPSTTAATTSTTAPATGPSAASPVEGLDASELQAAIAAPGAAGRSISGPTVDQVTLADGTRVWRVRVPGSFTARSARVSVSVGNRVVGEGVLAPDLGSITAVTTDGTGLTAGKPVSYRWEGSPSVAAGNLAVVR